MSFFISSSVLAQWKYEEYTNEADGAVTPVADGTIIPLSDPLLAAPNSKPAVTAVHEINNIITLAFKESAQFGSTLLPDNFSITVNTSISVLQTAGGTPVTTTRSFTINYDKNNPYKRSDIFYFTNGREVNVTINTVVPNNISDNLARSIIIMTNDMRIDRSYTTNCADCGVGAFNNYPTNITGNTDALPVSWPANKWAKAYDLEWTYISNEAYADGRYGSPGSAGFARNVFRNNATRVTVNGMSYKIPLLFNDAGHVLFRYRAVQQLPGGERLTSLWSPEYNLSGGLGNASFTGHQTNLTWQAATSFAEEGKLKSAVGYFDGTLRQRQSVTKDNITTTTIVSETLYDHQGRPAISVLPAPTLSNIIAFTPLATTKLDLNAPGSEYTKDLYDGQPADYCGALVPGMGTDAGASQYYSPANTLMQNGFNRFIPDAENYPFTETKYTQDNTGRIAAQGGVGKQFQLGTGHETKYYYASASQNDLDALFGTDAGDAAHYQKNMMRDANGQYSVTYIDMKGRTVATALAGNAPSGLEKVHNLTPTTRTEALLSPVNNMVKGNSVVFTRTLLVPEQAPYSFTYSLNPQTLRLANKNGNDVCYDCLYDLTITISDECGNRNMPGGVPYVYKKSNFSLNSINSLCSDPARGLSESFQLTLPEGSYTVTKELSISQAGKEYYRDNIYMPNNLKTTFEDIYHEQSELVKQQLGDCNTNGDIAKTDLDDVNDYGDRMYAQMTGDGVYAAENRPWFEIYSRLYSRFNNSDALVRFQMLRRHPEYQVYNNYSQLVQSNKWDDAMSKVMTYQDAVQGGYLNPFQMTSAPASAFPATNPDPLNDPTYRARMQDYLNKAMVTRVILGTVPVEWANLWSLSNMLTKCGIQANGGMDATCIAFYKNPANVFNTTAFCESELNDAWNKFKATYLAKKKMLTSDFMFAQGYPVVDENHRLFIDPRRYINQQELGINPNETDPSVLQQQAQQKLAAMIDQNCRNYAAYWWSKLDEAGCGFDKARDSAAIVERLIAVCKEGGDENHPFGASTVKPSSTYAFKSFNETILDYISTTPAVSQDVTLCNGFLINAPAPYERPFVTVNKTITDKPSDCECGNVQGLYQVYQTRYASKYTTMSAFMQAVYKTTITDGALDTLRRMCNGELQCSPINNVATDLTFSTLTSGDHKATRSITLDPGFESDVQFTAEIVPQSGPMVVVLPPALQCGNIQTVCVDCEKVKTAYNTFTEVFSSVTPTKNEDELSKNTFFAGFMNDKTGLYKTATEYLDFITTCDAAEGNYPGSLEIGNVCVNDNITVTPTGLSRPSHISCTDLVKTYQHFIAEFPNHTKGATVRMYLYGGGMTFNNSPAPEMNNYVMAANHRPGPNVPDFRQVLQDTIPGQDTIPFRSKSLMTTLAAPLPTGYWIDSALNARQLFEWYMNQHFNSSYSHLHYADWLVNGCGYKLNQLPWSDTVAVRADTLQKIWSRFVARYPVSQTSITETVQVPVVKGVVSTTLHGDGYYPEFLNAMTWTQGGEWYIMRGANTYNLSVLPRNASIQSANLSLYATNQPWTYAAHFRYTSQMPFFQIQQVKGLYIPGYSTFSTQPDYYSGVPGFNGAPLSEQQSGGGGSDFWSNQHYLNQNVQGLVSAMYSNMQSTGVNYPVQYKLNEETTGSGHYKKFQFGSTEAADISRRPVLNVTYSASRCEVFTAFVNNALGTYLNLAEIKALYTEKGKMVINENCTAFAGGAGCGSTVKVYKSDLLLCGANVEPTFTPLPESVLPNACKDSVAMAWAATQEIYNFRRDSLLGNFDDAYTQKCLSAAAFEGLTMEITSQIGEYNYTLYYYDQVGNLVKTVPPAGVQVNRDPAWLQLVKDRRAAGQTETPDHTQYTIYRYNSLNQVISQYSPDGGLSNFWYDRMGRLAVSRNAEQKKTNLYSYTLYDHLGRITETGQKQQPNGMTDATARKVDWLDGWVNLNNITYPHTQVTRTVYDNESGISQGHVYPGFSQKPYTLRNRVSYTQLFDQLQYNNNVPDYVNYAQATYFNYDIHGNVETLLQDYASGAMAINGYNRFKMAAYNYDLISGKVNLVSYQPGKQDEMYQRHVYDADNKITEVFTTHRRVFVGDQNVEERDASYSYYRHGSLARTELGNNKVQGVDYAYTLQGWLRGVNSTALNPSFDMGEDGNNASSQTARDAIGFSLNYYTGDYITIDATKLPFAAGTSVPGYKPLYNGNINHMSVGIKGMETMLYNYGYDQLNRMVSMNAFNNFNSNTNQWISLTPAGKYGETITYDGNGNIQTYNRDGDKTGADLPMDRLQFNYISGTGQLDHITDAVTDDTRYGTDLDGQAAGNYDYDASGNLTKDTKENIDKIYWTVYGKIKRIEKTDGMIIEYTYDATGNRISKKLSGTGVTGGPITTWYVRDGHGNTLATYTVNSSGITVDEQYIYGKSRLGAKNRNLTLNSSLSIASGNVPGIGTVYDDEMMRGKTQYELSNHLGNVLATISDRKVPHITGSTIDYYEAQVISAQDYYPFGMVQPGRSYNAGGYRFGFNGKENDNEVKGEGNQLEFGSRIYDPRIGRWFSVDPLRQVYTSLSPYSFGANNPLNIADADGNILRDKDGNIIATANGNTINERVFGEGDVTYVIKSKSITIYTDKGRPVSADLIVGFVKRVKNSNGEVTETPVSKLEVNGNRTTSEAVKANCHGYAFTEGSLNIGSGREKILEDEYDFLGRSDKTNEDLASEQKAGVVVIYGAPTPYNGEGPIDGDFWFHTGMKEEGGTWTDKDDYTLVRKNMQSSKDVENSPLKSPGDKQRLFYKRKTEKDKVVTSLPSVGKDPSGVRMVTEEQKDKVLSTVNN